jgi:uncharacterized protein (TIGR03118 family)
LRAARRDALFGGLDLQEHQMQRVRSSWAAFAFGAALALVAVPAAAASFAATPLVTDDPAAHPAQVTDAGLVNAWGIAASPTGPFWVSSNRGGSAVLYSVNPLTQATAKLGLTVAIPGAGNVTGQVFNSNAAAAFGGDLFLFVSEDGTVSGWRGALGTTAETLAPASDRNIYKGAAFATIAGDSYLYAANFRAGSVDVYKGSAGAPSLTGSFADPTLPSGYAPFNVQNLNGSLYVAYALQDAAAEDEIAGPGLGFVNRFDLQGNLLDRVASEGTLDAPWGLAIAPASFGAWAGALLVGNFGDGRISAFDAASNAFLGQVLAADGLPLSIDGLWALAPGNGGAAGSSQRLYFSAGPDNETHGLFGVLTPVPEPSTVALLLVGLAAITRRVSARARRADSSPSLAPA